MPDGQKNFENHFQYLLAGVIVSFKQVLQVALGAPIEPGLAKELLNSHLHCATALMQIEEHIRLLEREIAELRSNRTSEGGIDGIG